MKSFVLLLLSAVQLGAQSVQYRSPEGVEYRSLPDTGPVARAQAAVAADPRNVQKYLDLGAAQAAARQFREAIETYTRALAIDSTNATLYRWRGHRYLSIRDYRAGYADLLRTLELDAANYGAHYHLGVLRFVTGAHSMAVRHFAEALLNPPSASETAGSTDWLWLSLQRAGMRDAAAELLQHRPDSVPVQNAYARRLRLYRGELAPDSVLTASDTADVQVATLAYGLGNWYLLRGDTATATQLFTRAIRSGGWPAFGFMAAESELRRLRWARELPGNAAMAAYLGRIDAALRPWDEARDALMRQLRSRPRSSSADSAFRQFRRDASGLVARLAAGIRDSVFAVRADPGGRVARAARAVYGRELAPIPRESELADMLRARLSSHAVRLRIAQDSLELEPDLPALLELARPYLTAAAMEAATTPDPNRGAPSPELQERGKDVMGVDQYTSKHVFESLPDGGRIMLQRDDASDTASIRAIRGHMRDIERDFRAGEFSKPFAVHAMEVPGTRVMAARRDQIAYAMSDLPRGAQLRIISRDPAAVRAIHEFLAFQRSDHRAAGHHK